MRAPLAYVPTSTGAVHVRMVGTRRPGQTPIVLLHHTPSSGEAMAPLAAALAPRWSVAPDLPGFGASDPLPAPSVPAWGRAVAEVLTRLEVRGAIVFGHHAGAAVAVRVAVELPALVSRLVLSAPPFLDAAALGALERRVSPPLAPQPDGAHVAAAWQRVTAKTPDLALHLAHRETVAALAAGAGYVAAYHAVLAHDLAADLAALTVPAIVTAGPDDPLAPMARRAAALARARFHPLAAGGAHVHATAPGALAALFDLDPHLPDEEP